MTSFVSSCLFFGGGGLFGRNNNSRHMFWPVGAAFYPHNSPHWGHIPKIWGQDIIWKHSSGKQHPPGEWSVTYLSEEKLISLNGEGGIKHLTTAWGDNKKCGVGRYIRFIHRRLWVLYGEIRREGGANFPRLRKRNNKIDLFDIIHSLVFFSSARAIIISKIFFDLVSQCFIFIILILSPIHNYLHWGVHTTTQKDTCHNTYRFSGFLGGLWWEKDCFDQHI